MAHDDADTYRARVDWPLIARWLHRNPNRWRRVEGVSTGVVQMIRQGKIGPIAALSGRVEVAHRGLYTEETRRGTTKKGTLHIRVVRERRRSG